VGSLVEDETRAIVLIVDEAGVDEAVRDLVRIGYDNVVGFATAETLTRYFDRGGASASIEEIGFADVVDRKDDPGAVVLDVRFAAEHEAAHIPGSIQASYTRLPSYVREEGRIPRDRKLLVHCVSGGRSAAAAAFLVREGFDVAYVNGPFESYRTMGEVVSGEPAATTA
jgi:hydroxyacylglutathione hydrolase